MADGISIDLLNYKPGYHSEAYYYRKSDFSRLQSAYKFVMFVVGHPLIFSRVKVLIILLKFNTFKQQFALMVFSLMNKETYMP